MVVAVRMNVAVNSDLASQFAIEFIEATSSPREPPSIYMTNILIKDLVHLVDGVY